MITVQASVMIEKPVAEVFAFVTCLDNLPRWVPGPTARKLTPEPFGEGTLLEQSSPLGKFVLKVANYQVNKGFQTQSLTAPLSLKAQGELVLEAVPEGTRVRLGHHFLLPWWLRPLEPLFARQAQRGSEEVVRALKKVLDPTN